MEVMKQSSAVRISLPPPSDYFLGLPGDMSCIDFLDNSAAIGKNSSVPTYFTNRALCYLKKSQWDLVIRDCKRALDLDPNLVKAHFFMGQALQVRWKAVLAG